MTGKRCVRCQSLQPLYRFNPQPPHQLTNDGLRGECVDCESEYVAQLHHHIARREPITWGGGQ